MSYISALTTYLEEKRIIVKSFTNDLDIGCDRYIVSVFINEHNDLCMGIDDCGFLFTDKINEFFAEKIIDHLLETENIFIPIDE